VKAEYLCSSNSIVIELTDQRPSGAEWVGEPTSGTIVINDVRDLGQPQVRMDPEGNAIVQFPILRPEEHQSIVTTFGATIH
jgi:hypothetical protein